MRNLLYTILFASAVGCLLTACNKEAEITRLSEVVFPHTFSTSTNTAVVTKDNGESTVATLTWDAANYGIKAPVTYSLQFDLPSDTVGTTPWSKAQELTIGDDILSKAITANELNQLATTGLGLEAGKSSAVVVRVKSYVDRTAYSNAITLLVTPWQAPVVNPTYPSLWVPGDYQGWSPATAPTITSPGNNQLYEGYINFAEGGTFQFKFTAQADWTPMAYGDGGNGVLIEANYSGGNCSVPSAGYYELSANLKTMTWTAVKTSWGIIGDATPGGWNTDTQMTYDSTNQVWTVTCDMTSTGSFKFRANNEWKIDFGIDADGKLQYADNPLYPYNGTLANITVPSSGNYTISLDLHTAGNYTYKLKKN